MTPSDLLSDFREVVDDQVLPYLYTDTTAFRWMAEAEREAAVRARLIYDETTVATCRIAIVAGQVRYPIDPRMFDVLDVWLDRPATGVATYSKHLARVDQSNARRAPYLYNLENPESLYTHHHDYGNDWCGGNGALRLGNELHQYSIDGPTMSLYTIPDTSFTDDPAIFRLCGYRLPLVPVADNTSVFEIPDVHHDGLIHWLLYRAYKQKDAEELDDKRSLEALATFESRFGSRPPANSLRMQAEGRSWQTGYGGY